MADYQRVVEFLRDVRQGPLQEVTDEIAHAATAYAQFCADANERLRKCSTFLQQGLRTEALHLADAPPNLLDMVAALDLPDPLAWSEFCQNNGLPVPQPLQVDRATQLNDAYAADQPLEHMLSQHRLLALSRGPVRERLLLLRRLAEADAANPSWEKDIRTFEKARLKELPTVFYNAVRMKDEPSIAELNSEITQTTWLEAVPSDLANAVGEAFSRVQRAGVESQLRALLPAMREAYAAQSLMECKAVLERWKGIMSGAGVQSVSADLVDEYRPVAAYVVEQEKREEKLKKFRDMGKIFSKMLDQDATNEQLEPVYAKLEAFGEPIPEDLESRYEAKLLSRQQAVARSHRTKMIGIGASAAAIVIVVLAVFMVMNKSSQAQKWASQIHRAVEAKDFALAQQYAEGVRKAGYAGETSVAAALREVDTLQAAHDRDAATRQNLVNRMDSAAAAGNTAEANKDAHVEEILAASNTIQDVLQQEAAAGDLSWVDSDKKLATQTVALQAMFDKLRSQASTIVTAQVGTISDKLNALPDDATAAHVTILNLQSQTQQLVSLTGLDDHTREQVQTISQKVQQAAQNSQTAQGVNAALESIRVHTGSASELKRELASFAQQFPNDLHTADFDLAASRLSLAEDAEAWRNVVESWGTQYDNFNLVSGQKRIQQINDYLAAHPSSPLTSLANKYLEFLRAETDSLMDNGTWQKALNDLFTNPLISDLSYMETTDGQKFYTVGDIKRVDRRINNITSVSFDALDPTDATKRMTVSVDPPAKLKNDQPLKAPHTKLVADMRNQLRLLDGRNWDTWGIDAVQKLRDAKDVDTIVKAILIQEILKAQTSINGWAIGDVYADTLQALSRIKPETQPWIGGGNSDTKVALDSILANLPAAAAVKTKLAAAKQELFNSVRVDLLAVGVMLKKPDGSWMLACRSDVKNGDGFTVLPPSGDAPPTPAAAPAAPAPTPATTEATTAPAEAATPVPETPAAIPGRWVKIGTVRDGQWAWYSDSTTDLPQGSIVYITKPVGGS